MIPYYCRPCGEMLTEDQAQCPFCDRPASKIDEVSCVASWHHGDCEWHHEHVAAECSCIAQGIEARQRQDAKRLDPKDESPVRKDAPNPHREG